MKFNEYIESNRGGVYSTICRYLPIREPEEHYRIAREYTDRQGSYRRPGLLLLSSEMFGAKPGEALLPAAAMQLSEDWILVHDDVEDNSELRRGKPALHKLYGPEIAINAGDAAHIAMWRILKDYMIGVKDGRGNLLYEKFYDMMEKTVEGQYIETNFIYNSQDLSKATEDLYLKIIESKAAYYSVYGPLQLGAISAGITPGKQLDALKDIGMPAGLAFQIMDDILDMTADEKVFGKKRYGDLYEGKLTLIIYHTFQSASDAEKEKINAIYKKRREAKTEDDISFLADMIGRHGGIEYARAFAERYSNSANEMLEKHRDAIPSNEKSEMLVSALESLYKRSK